ncbi:MAG: TaqI-like C-terminal specificity domain-containing protein [Methylococcales bacterium]|nr:TaqI-like C-terminal specificity domain-containing protein [Methylococcales bacterium]MDD5755022.1 TaqI-like C-terminal specificity domain-containing protein [Methylococcales bacterium]
MNAKLHQLSVDKAAEVIGVSTATMRNWVKAGHIIPVEQRPLSFLDHDVNKLKNSLANGSLQKLINRANKANSTANILPSEYVSNNVFVDNIKTIKTFVDEKKLNVNLVLFVATIKLLTSKSELIFDKTKSLFSTNSFKNWKRNSVKIEIENWLKELSHAEQNNYIKLYDSITLTDDDFLGLLYQCLSSEGSKSNKGSYYTPVKLIEDSLCEIKKNSNDNTFLDPCCGTGNYLISAVKILRLQPKKILGFDIDSLAVKIARINLLLAYPEVDFSPNVYCLDSLNELATGDVFCQTNHFLNSIDVIATNPPWGASKNDSTETFSLFLQKSLQLLKDNGQLSFILPESILNVKTHSIIRHTLLTQGKILKIIKLGRQFTGVFTPVIRLDFLKTSKNTDNLVTIQNDENVFHVEQKRFLTNSNYVFDIDVSANEAKLLQKIYAIPHNTLFQNAEWALGIVTGDNKKHLSDIKLQKSESVFRGADIQAFCVNEPKLFLNFEPKNFQQVAPERFFRMPEKLIYRFISKTLTFAYDDKQRLTLNSANILIPKIPNVSLKVALAYLNSSLFQYLFKKQFSTHKVLRGDLEKLPFPILSNSKHNKIEQIVEQVLNDKNKYDQLDALIFSTFHLSNSEITIIHQGLKK